jgi:hypothetical protein
VSVFFLDGYAQSISNIVRYFGRAKDLPGVKELFQSRKKEEEEENQAFSFYKQFMNQGPAYYGDLDESDGRLLKFEGDAENKGKFLILLQEDNFNFLLPRIYLI